MERWSENTKRFIEGTLITEKKLVHWRNIDHRTESGSLKVHWSQNRNWVHWRNTITAQKVVHWRNTDHNTEKVCRRKRLMLTKHRNRITDGKGTWKHPPKKRNMETPTKEKEHGNTHQRKGTWKHPPKKRNMEKTHWRKGTWKQTHRGKGTLAKRNRKIPIRNRLTEEKEGKILIKGNGTWKRIVNEKKKHENRLAEGLGARKETSVKQGNYNDPITDKGGNHSLDRPTYWATLNGKESLSKWHKPSSKLKWRKKRTPPPPQKKEEEKEQRSNFTMKSVHPSHTSLK